MKTIILIVVLYVSWTLAEPPKPYCIGLRKRHAIIKRDVSHLLGNQGKSHSHHHHHHNHHQYDGMDIPSLNNDEQTNDKSQYKMGKYAGIPMMGWFDKNPAFGVSRLPSEFENTKIKSTKHKKYQNLEPLRHYLPAAQPGVNYLMSGNSVKYPSVHYSSQQKPGINTNQPIHGGGYYNKDKLIYQSEQPGYEIPAQVGYVPQQTIYTETSPQHTNVEVANHKPISHPAGEISPQQQTYTEKQPAHLFQSQLSIGAEEPIVNYKPIPHPAGDISSQQQTYTEKQPAYPIQSQHSNGAEEPVFNYKPIPHPGVDVPSRNYLPIPVESKKHEIHVPSNNYIPVPIEQTPPSVTDINLIETPSEHYLPAPPSPTDNTAIETPSKNYIPVPSVGFLPPLVNNNEHFDYWQQADFRAGEKENPQTQASFEDQKENLKYKKNPWKPVVYDHQTLSSFDDYKQQQNVGNSNPGRNQWYKQGSEQKAAITNDEKYQNKIGASTELSGKIEEIGGIEKDGHIKTENSAEYQFTAPPPLVHSQKPQWNSPELNSKTNQIAASPVANYEKEQWFNQAVSGNNYQNNQAVSDNNYQHNQAENDKNNQYNQAVSDNNYQHNQAVNDKNNEYNQAVSDKNYQHNQAVNYNNYQHKEASYQNNLNQHAQSENQISSAKNHWSKNVQSRYRHKDHSTVTHLPIQKQIKEEAEPKQQFHVENLAVLHSYINENAKEGRYLRSNEKQEAVFNGYDYPKPEVVLEEGHAFSKIRESEHKNLHDVKDSTHGDISNIEEHEDGNEELIKYHEQTFTGIKHKNPVKLIEDTEKPEAAHEVENHFPDEVVVLKEISNVLEPPKHTSGSELNQSQKSSKYSLGPIKKYHSYKPADKGFKDSNKDKQKFTSGVKDGSGYYFFQTPEVDPLYQHKDIFAEINQHKQVQQLNHHVPESKYQKIVESHFPSGNKHEKVSDLVISVSQNHHHEIDQFQHASKNVATWSRAPEGVKIQKEPDFHENAESLNADYQQGKYTQQEVKYHQSSARPNVEKTGSYNRESKAQLQINGEDHEVIEHHQIPSRNYLPIPVESQNQEQEIDHEVIGGHYDHLQIPSRNYLPIPVESQKQEQEIVHEDEGAEKQEHQSPGLGNGHELKFPHKENAASNQTEDYKQYQGNRVNGKGKHSRKTLKGRNQNKVKNNEYRQYQAGHSIAHEQQEVKVASGNEYQHQHQHKESKSNFEQIDYNHGSKSNKEHFEQNQNKYRESKSNLEHINQDQYEYHESEINLEHFDDNQNKYHGSKANLEGDNQSQNKYHGSKTNLEQNNQSQNKYHGSKANLEQNIQSQYKYQESNTNLEHIDENQNKYHESKTNLEHIDENQNKYYGSKTNLEQNNQSHDEFHGSKSNLEQNNQSKYKYQGSNTKLVHINDNQNKYHGRKTNLEQHKHQESKTNLEQIDQNQYKYYESSQKLKHNKNQHKHDGNKSNYEKIAQSQYKYHGSKSNLEQLDESRYEEHGSESIYETNDQNQYKHEENKSNNQYTDESQYQKLHEISPNVENDNHRQKSEAEQQKNIGIPHKYQHQENQQLDQNQYQQHRGIKYNVQDVPYEKSKENQQENSHHLHNDFKTEDYGIEFSYGNGNGSGSTKVWLDPTHGIPQQREPTDNEDEENLDDDVEIHEIVSNPESGEDNKSEDLILVLHTDLLRGNDRFRGRGRGGRGRNDSGRGGRGGRGRGNRHRDDYRAEDDRRPKPQNSGKDEKKPRGKGKENLVQENQAYTHPNHSASNGHSQVEPKPYYY